MYEANLYENNPHTKILSQGAVVSLFVYKVYMVLLPTTALAFACLPLIMLWCFGAERDFMLYIFIPGIDEQTLTGYTVLTCLHVFYLAHAGWGITCGDCIFSSLVIHIWPMTRIFSVAMDDLNRCLAKYDCRNKQAMVHMRLRNIMLMHRELYKYICIVILIQDI